MRRTTLPYTPNKSRQAKQIVDELMSRLQAGGKLLFHPLQASSGEQSKHG